MGLFIQIDIKASTIESEKARRVVELCPVDIFEISADQLSVNAEREDECTLCELCLDAAPAGVISIRKTYKDEQLISRAEE